VADHVFSNTGHGAPPRVLTTWRRAWVASNGSGVVDNGNFQRLLGRGLFRSSSSQHFPSD